MTSIDTEVHAAASFPDKMNLAVQLLKNLSLGHATGILTKTASYTIKDNDPDTVVVGAITALAHATFTLPTCADNTGRCLTFIVGGDPGSNNVVIDGEGSETINGATTKTNSTQYNCITILCDGTEWFIVNAEGTWT